MACSLSARRSRFRRPPVRTSHRDAPTPTQRNTPPGATDRHQRDLVAGQVDLRLMSDPLHASNALLALERARRPVRAVSNVHCAVRAARAPVPVREEESGAGGQGHGCHEGAGPGPRAGQAALTSRRRGLAASGAPGAPETSMCGRGDVPARSRRCIGPFGPAVSDASGSFVRPRGRCLASNHRWRFSPCGRIGATGIRWECRLGRKHAVDVSSRTAAV
jgi:hypothetical protein